jgi:hypothetical protein
MINEGLYIDECENLPDPQLIIQAIVDLLKTDEIQDGCD